MFDFVAVKNYGMYISRYIFRRLFERFLVNKEVRVEREFCVAFDVADHRRTTRKSKKEASGEYSEHLSTIVPFVDILKVADVVHNIVSEN